MDKVTKYKVLESVYIDDLVDEVNNLIDDGWEPLGSLAITHDHKNNKDFKGTTSFFQALVFKEKVK